MLQRLRSVFDVMLPDALNAIRKSKSIAMAKKIQDPDYSKSIVSLTKAIKSAKDKGTKVDISFLHPDTRDRIIFPDAPIGSLEHQRKLGKIPDADTHVTVSSAQKELDRRVTRSAEIKTRGAVSQDELMDLSKGMDEVAEASDNGTITNRQILSMIPGFDEIIPGLRNLDEIDDLKSVEFDSLSVVQHK